MSDVLVMGYPAAGRKAHAVDTEAVKNRQARMYGWTDAKTGKPYAEALCGTVVAPGGVAWSFMPGICCARCGQRATR